MINSISNEVDRSRRELGLEERLRPLPTEQAEALYEAIESRFSIKPGARWIWEHLRSPHYSTQLSDGDAYEQLQSLVPRPREELFFLPGSDQDRVCAYVGTIDTIATVLGDCFGFEYIIAPSDLAWMLCENHHDILCAAGEELAARFAVLPR